MIKLKDIFKNLIVNVSQCKSPEKFMTLKQVSSPKKVTSIKSFDVNKEDIQRILTI